MTTERYLGRVRIWPPPIGTSPTILGLIVLLALAWYLGWL
jgi:hypothetical protein